MRVAEPSIVSALVEHLVPGRFGRADGAAGVMLQEVTVSAMAQLAGVTDAQALNDALSIYGLDAVPAPLRGCQGETLRLLWTGPGQYLAVSRGHQGVELALSLGTAVSDLGGVAVDLSHARTIVRLSGAACVELLAKGCALDLETMRTGDCTNTALGHFNVLLHRESEQTFDVYVTRSFAVACFEWLLHAGEEFGVRVR